MRFLELDKEDKKERVKLVLRYLVFQSGYSQRRLAKRLGVNRSRVGHVLTGEQSLSLIDTIDWFDALDVSPAKFYELLDKGVGIEEDWVREIKKP